MFQLLSTKCTKTRHAFDGSGTSRLFDRARDFFRNQQAVAAVEFALITPFMVALWLGSIEIAQVVSADRKVSHASSALADLVTQQTNLTRAEMDDIMDATLAIMAPLDMANLSIRLAGVEIDDDGDTRVVWSESRNGPAPAVGGEYEIPEGLLLPDTFLVVASLTYAHTPATTYAITGTFNLTDQFFLRPRRSAEITYEG